MTNKARKIYTGEFKAAAVKLVAEGKQSGTTQHTFPDKTMRVLLKPP